MRIISLSIIALALMVSTASAAVYRIPAVRMPAVFRVATPPVAPTLNIVVPTTPVAPTLASILAARGFNLNSMPRR